MLLKLLDKNRHRRLFQFFLCFVLTSLFIYFSLYGQGYQIFGWQKTNENRYVRRIFTDELTGEKRDQRLKLNSFCLDGSPLPPSQRQEDNASPLDLDVAASLIKLKYSQLLESTLANANDPSCQPVVMEYRCSEKRGFRCGGLGDRFRGVVATFYAALLTNTVFSVHWAFPTKLEDFFEPQFFTRSFIREKLLPKEPAEYERRVVDAEHAIVDIFNNTNVIRELLAWHDVLAYQVNSLVALEVFTSNPYYRPLINYYGLASYTYSQFFAIAIRVLLPRYSNFLEKSLAPFIANLKSPRYDARFGLQVRLGSSKWGEYDRVGFGQLDCFISELVNTTRKNSYRNIFVFVTADSDAGVEKLEISTREALKRISINVNVTSAGNVASITHIDRSDFNSEGNQKAALLRTFVDWAVLAAPEIDHLIISRSSFGETASLMQLKRPRIDSSTGKRTVRRLLHNVTERCAFDDYEMTSFRMEGSACQNYNNKNATFMLISVLISLAITVFQR